MKGGYLASVVGAVIGAAALGGAGVLVAFALADNATDDSNGSTSFGEVFGDLFGIVVVGVLLALAGIWIGATVGCWLGLKVAGHDGAGRSALVLAVLLPVWVVVTIVVLNAAFQEVPGGVAWPALVATVVLPPIAARSLTGRRAVS